MQLWIKIMQKNNYDVKCVVLVNLVSIGNVF